MRTRKLLLLVIAGCSSTRCCSAKPEPNSPHMKRGSFAAREIISEDDISEAYDFVIAGGGLAGLVLASRLSANSSNTVLVLEAGLSGDAVADRINPPAGAYYSSIVGTEYDWGHVTVPQPSMNNRSVSWPRGKILGGSSAMNAMYLVRPAQEEMDAWQQVISSDDDETSWGWDEMYAAMRKAENFTEPSPQVASIANIQWNASTHGSGGPMSVSYPGVMMQIVGNWTSSLNTIGIPTLPNPNGGITLGGFVTPSSINPTNWTRSYSRSAYIDPLPPRSNLHILPAATVTRLLFREQATLDGWVADRVEFARSADAPRRTVRVRREVILAGGSLGSPKILMNSGFGPKDVLENANVTLLEELPGVGQRLQDHVTAGLVWESTLETAGNIRETNPGFASTPEFLSFINDAVAFVNITTLFGTEGATAFQRQISDAAQTSATTLVPSPDSEISEGYKVVYDILVNTFLPRTAQIEFLMSVVSPNTITIQAALQHPFSQGRLYINSSNPFEPVIVDPNYFSHFADLTILRQGVKLVRTLGSAFGNLLGAELSPGLGVQTDEDWEGWLRGEAANSQFHPSSSCAMLPRAQGGVVDSKLRVYGAANVRVADSSVFPFEFAAHLGSATYGLAERAAEILQVQSYIVPNGARMLIYTLNVLLFCTSFVILATGSFV